MLQPLHGSSHGDVSDHLSLQDASRGVESVLGYRRANQCEVLLRVSLAEQRSQFVRSFTQHLQGESNSLDDLRDRRAVVRPCQEISCGVLPE